MPAKIRALGSRHSFNDIADTAGTLVVLDRLDAGISVDAQNMTVTVSGGTRYGTLAAELPRRGFALHNLASLPHISVAGAVATATHGSGDRNGNLATAVGGAGAGHRRRRPCVTGAPRRPGLRRHGRGAGRAGHRQPR